MLQIQNICKSYKTGNLIQNALDNVSLNLRDCEFVAILGPSGSGKTTLLNVIGGLDHYDSGDLIINRVSTKKYSDRDWDSYRNHTIGFVFQNYSLIPHQTILANVELALTISGVGKRERKKRALEALEKVGLKEQCGKRPAQLSGGQMQRVAIARALVNNPEILLADEPTGALDSKTSIQVMDLLREVAADRLVVLVTHNPELADQYASRIINLRDGKIISDSNPLPDGACVLEETGTASPDEASARQGLDSGCVPEETGVASEEVIEPRKPDSASVPEETFAVSSHEASEPQEPDSACALEETGVASEEVIEPRKPDSASVPEETFAASSHEAIEPRKPDSASVPEETFAASSHEASELQEADSGCAPEETSSTAPSPGKPGGEGFPRKSGRKGAGRSSMSFLTALSLSFNNLRTKWARTLLTSIAGSIGIIGIALILSASAGVKAYISDEQESMLYAYPIEILNTTASVSMFMQADNIEKDQPDEVGIMKTLTRLFSTVDSNDLKSLRSYFEGDSDIYEYVNAIEYTYNIKPQIFFEDSDGFRQVNPNEMLSKVNAGFLSASASPLASLFSYNVFYELPAKSSAYKDEYEIVSGHWAEDYDECVVVLDPGGNINDVTMYTLGLRDSLELQDMVDQFLAGEKVDMPEDFGTYRYDDIVGTRFKVVNAADFYRYDKKYGGWVERRTDQKGIRRLAAKGETLTVVGVMRPSEDAAGALLSEGIYYTADLTEHLIDNAAKSRIVREQMAHPDIDVFTGEKFGSKTPADIDFSKLFDIDVKKIADAFQFDASAIEDALGGSVDFSDYIDIDLSSIDLPEITGAAGAGDLSDGVPAGTGSVNLEDIMKKSDVRLSEKDIRALISKLLSGYREYAADNPEADFSQLEKGFRDYLETGDALDILFHNIRESMAAGSNESSFNRQLSKLASSLAELGTSVADDFEQYCGEQGYSDGTLTALYFIEYVREPRVTELIRTWAGENLHLRLRIAKVTPEQLTKLVSDLTSGYREYANGDGLPTIEKIKSNLLKYLGTDEGQRVMADGIADMLNIRGIRKQVLKAVENYARKIMDMYGDEIESWIEEAAESVMDQILEQVISGIENAMSELPSRLSGSIGDVLQIDTDELKDAFALTMDTAQLSELLASFTSPEKTTYEGNLANLGFADLDEPSEISIYPKDFESKQTVISILDDYNAEMSARGEQKKVISYTDNTSSMTDSMTNMVNIISAVMIAIVAISLIVSSIMIAVIMYISVMERRNEIGILRALGASRRNISEVFNAEAIIIGLCAGLLGIAVAYILIIPINSFIRSYIGSDDVRIFLPALYAAALVAISVALTLFSGLLPASKAARSDPVESLRNE